MNIVEKPAAALRASHVLEGEGVKINVLGDNQCHKITGEQSGGLLTMIENSNPPGVSIPLHYHATQEEVFYVLEGKVEFTVADQTIIAEKGATLFAPRMIPHAWKIVGDQTAKMLIMIFPGGEKMFHELHQTFANVAPTPEKIMAICGQHDVFFVPPGN